MKKFFIILLSTVASVLGLIYLAFLIVPPFINLDGFKSEIQKQVLDNTKLNLNYSKLRLYSTPVLSVGVIIENIEIKLDDNSTLFKTPRIKAGVALPSLLTLTVKTSNCYIDNPYINLEIADGKQYKIVRVVEQIINENNKKPPVEPTNEPENEFVNNLIEKITIKVPSIKITNYNLNIKDLKTIHGLNLKGDELVLGYKSKNNVVKVKTDAKLLSDNKENINANIKAVVALGKIEPAPKEEVDPEEVIQIPFINIVDIYQKYDLKTNVDSKLLIKPAKKHGYVVKGYFNVDDLNLKLGDIRLPNSFLHTKFKGKRIEYDSNIYTKSDEKISLQGMLKYGKHAGLKTKIQSEKISFSNLFDLSIALLDSLNIRHGLNSAKVSGYLTADAIIDTNFKTLKSQGEILIKDGYFINPSSSIGIKDVNADLIFDNNELNIKNAKALINNSKLALDGSIDRQTNTNVKAKIENLSLSALYNSFAPKELKKEFLLTSANLDTTIDIKGKLEKLNAKIYTKLSALALCDAKKTMFITNKKTNVDFNITPNLIKGSIQNEGFKFSLPQAKTTVLVNSASVNVDNEEIKINPFDIVYNDISKINIKGEIEDYLKNPEVDIFISGGITTQGIKQTLGKEISHFLPSGGIIPIKAKIEGDSKKQHILAQIYSDSNNFISPIDLKELYNNPSLIQTDISIQGNKIKLKNTGLYKKAAVGFSNDLETNAKNAKQLVDLAVVLDNNHINLFRLNIPQDIAARVSIFKKSSFRTKGKLTLHGNLDDIKLGGDLKINDINIPEILFKTKSLNLDLISQGLNVSAKEIDLNGSKIDGSLSADLKPSNIFKISNIIVNSNFIDVDNSMKVLDKLMSYMPPAASTSNSSNNSANNDIPIYADGKFNIQKLKSGEIIVNDIKGNLLVKNNILFINRLTCKAFDGDIKGNISMNLISGLLGIKLTGNGLDSDKTMAQGAGLKDTISGTMDFKTDLSLKGATYIEQVKSLKGNVIFDLKDGQYGPFAKLENFFLAENIRENALFKNTIGIILTPIATIDSSHYENLSGTISFNNGIANLDSITSQGDILCILIKGNMDLVNNELDSKVRVRLASTVSDLLGPLSLANPVNLVKNTPGLNVGTAKLFSVFTQVVEEKEYKEIPMFSKNHTDENATKFQIVLKGDVNKPLKLVKSFKWLALQKDMDKAREFSDNYIKEEQQKARAALLEKLQKEYEEDNKLKVGVQKVLQMDTTAPKVKEAIVEEIIEKQKELNEKKQEKINEVENKIQNKIQDVKTEALKLQQEKLEELRNKVVK